MHLIKFPRRRGQSYQEAWENALHSDLKEAITNGDERRERLCRAVLESIREETEPRVRAHLRRRERKRLPSKWILVSVLAGVLAAVSANSIQTEDLLIRAVLAGGISVLVFATALVLDTVLYDPDE